MTFTEAVEKVVHTKTIAWHGAPLVSFKEMTGFEFWFVYYNEHHRDDPADDEKYMVRVTGSHFKDKVSYENFYWSTKLPKGIAEKRFEIAPEDFKVVDVARDISWLYQSLIKKKG